MRTFWEMPSVFDTPLCICRLAKSPAESEDSQSHDLRTKSRNFFKQTRAYEAQGSIFKKKRGSSGKSRHRTVFRGACCLTSSPTFDLAETTVGVSGDDTHCLEDRTRSIVGDFGLNLNDIERLC